MDLSTKLNTSQAFINTHNNECSAINADQEELDDADRIDFPGKTIGVIVYILNWLVFAPCVVRECQLNLMSL